MKVPLELESAITQLAQHCDRAWTGTGDVCRAVPSPQDSSPLARQQSKIDQRSNQRTTFFIIISHCKTGPKSAHLITV